MSRILFYKVDKQEAAIAKISKDLSTDLRAGKKVLLLLSGGSAIELEIELIDRLRKDPHDFCVCLADERFGRPGHPDSNWAQLKVAGLDSRSLQHYEILNGQDFQSATQAFNDFLEQAVSKFDVLVGILGMGADGHTAGILPGSPAVGSSDYAAGYNASDYRRITATPKFLAKLDKAFLYALGAPKHPQIENLKLGIAVSQQPAQILKKAGRLAIFNDYTGRPL